MADLALTAVAVLGAICFVALAAAVILDIRPIVFRSDSMAPAMPVRSLALVRPYPAAELQVGDVVCVPNGSGSRVTHRIVEIERQGEAANLTLRGDANEAPDAQPYDVTRAEKVIWSTPRLGAVVVAAQSAPFAFILGLIAGILGTIAFGVAGRRPHDGDGGEPGDGRSARPPLRRHAAVHGGRRRTVSIAGAAIVALVAGTAAGASLVEASYTDEATMSATFSYPSGPLVMERSAGETYLTNQYRAYSTTTGGWNIQPAPPTPIIAAAGSATNVLAITANGKLYTSPHGTYSWSGPQTVTATLRGSSTPVAVSPTSIAAAKQSSGVWTWFTTDKNLWYRSGNEGATWSQTAYDFPVGVNIISADGGYLVAATATTVSWLNVSNGVVSNGWTTLTPSFTNITAMATSSGFILVFADGHWYRGDIMAPSPLNPATDLDTTMRTPAALVGNGDSVFASCTQDRYCYWRNEDNNTGGVMNTPGL